MTRAVEKKELGDGTPTDGLGVVAGGEEGMANLTEYHRRWRLRFSVPKMVRISIYANWLHSVATLFEPARPLCGVVASGFYFFLGIFLLTNLKLHHRR
jgi:hypothetical protein